MSGTSIDGLPPLRDVVEIHGIGAKKALGQNFLFDLNLTSRIARAAGDIQGANVLEVGPGPGGLPDCPHLAELAGLGAMGYHGRLSTPGQGARVRLNTIYTNASNLPLDHIITTMLEAGLELHDINHLERLNDPAVLLRLPKERKWLKRNSREDAIFYMKEWCALLEDQLAAASDKLIDFDPEPDTAAVLGLPDEQVA